MIYNTNKNNKGSTD